MEYFELVPDCEPHGHVVINHTILSTDDTPFVSHKALHGVLDKCTVGERKDCLDAIAMEFNTLDKRAL